MRRQPHMQHARSSNSSSTLNPRPPPLPPFYPRRARCHLSQRGEQPLTRPTATRLQHRALTRAAAPCPPGRAAPGRPATGAGAASVRTSAAPSLSESEPDPYPEMRSIGKVRPSACVPENWEAAAAGSSSGWLLPSCQSAPPRPATAPTATAPRAGRLGTHQRPAGSHCDAMCWRQNRAAMQRRCGKLPCWSVKQAQSAVHGGACSACTCRHGAELLCVLVILQVALLPCVVPAGDLELVCLACAQRQRMLMC